MNSCTCTKNTLLLVCQQLVAILGLLYSGLYNSSCRIHFFMEQKIVFYTKNLIFIMMVRVMVFNATYFRYFMAVSFIGGGNRSTLRKPPTCHKSLTDFITQCCIVYLGGIGTHNVSGDRHSLHR